MFFRQFKTGLLLLVLGTALSGFLSAQTILYFNLDNASISGTQNAVNSKYTYAKADPGGLYDVVVTLLSQNATSLTFSNPQVDAVTGFTDGSTISGANAYLTPSWNLNDGTTVTSYSATMSFSIAVYRTGTTTAAPVTLFATSLDNDGSTLGGGGNVRERVVYGGSPRYTAVGSGQTRSGNQFTATTTANGAGVSTDPAFRIDAVYDFTSTFTWTASHFVDDLAPAGGNSLRISALQLGFVTVPEPSSAFLAVLSFSILACRRSRMPESV